MADDSLGRMVITIIADCADAQKEIAELSNDFDSLSKTGKTSSKSVEQMEDKIDSAGQSAKTAGEKMTQAATSTKKAGDAAEEATEEFGDLSDSTDDTKAGMSSMVGVAGKLSSALSVMGLGGVLINVAKWLLEQQDAAYKAIRSMETYTNSVGKAKDKVNELNAAKSKLISSDDEMEAATYEAVSREFVGYTDQQKLDLSQELLSQAELFGLSASDLAYSLDEIMQKFGISQDDAIQTLRSIAEVSKQQEGDYQQNVAENIAALKDYDNMYTAMGMTLEDTLKLFQSLDSDVNHKSVSESSSLLYREWTGAMSTKATAEETVADLQSQIAALQEQLKTADEETSAGIIAELESLRVELAANQEIVSKSSGDLLAELLSGATYSGLTGRDKDEVMEIAQIMQGSGEEMLATVDNVPREISKTLQEMLVDTVKDIGYFVSDVSTPVASETAIAATQGTTIIDNSWMESLEDSPELLDTLTSSTSTLTDLVAGDTNDSLTLMGEALGDINTATDIYNTVTNEVTLGAMDAEATSANNLADAYNRLADAKVRASGAYQ